MKRPSQSLPRRTGGGLLTSRAYRLPGLRRKALRAPRQLVVLEAQPQRWTTVKREERRYLYDDVRELIAAMNQHAEPRAYRTQTIYLGNSPKGRKRLRRYNREGPWYLEVKKRKGFMVRKRRRRFYGELPTGRLSGNYWRVAYEWGSWRLTIDSSIRFRLGKRSLLHPGYVVELKGRVTSAKAATPQWLEKLLSGHEAPGFGKRNWGLLALGG